MYLSTIAAIILLNKQPQNSVTHKNAFFTCSHILGGTVSGYSRLGLALGFRSGPGLFYEAWAGKVTATRGIVYSPQY